MAAKKKLVKKPADPWAGAAHGTPGFGVGSTAALQAYTPPPSAPPPPDPSAAARAQFNTLLGSATNSANRSYGYAVDDSIAGEGTTALDYGATLGVRAPGTDPAAATQGSYDWNSVEANNPFSKAGLLVRQYHQQQGRTTNSLAAQGQFNSGAYKNAQSQDNFGYQAGQDTLMKGLQSYLAEQARNRRNAGVTRDDTINAAGLSGLGSLLGS